MLLFLFFDDSFIGSNVLHANIVFPFTYAVDYLPEIVLKFLVGDFAGTFNFVHDVSFAPARGNHDQNIILTHIRSLLPSWNWNAFKVFENAR